MDITKILTTIKGKVLDATNFELLANAYDLQQQNITQLKENNAAIKESNILYKEKLEKLEKINSEQASLILKLEQNIAHQLPNSKNILSDDEKNILKICIENDKTDFTVSWLNKVINISNVKMETALEELEIKDFISASHSYMGEETYYYISTDGKKTALKL